MKEIKINYFLDEDGRKDDISKGGNGKELKSHKVPLIDSILFHQSQRISGCGTPALINLSDTNNYSIIKRKGVPFFGVINELAKYLSPEEKELNIKIIDAHNKNIRTDFIIDDYFSKSEVKKFSKVLNNEELYALAIENLDNLHKRKTEKEKFEKDALELNLEILNNFFKKNKELIKKL